MELKDEIERVLLAERVANANKRVLEYYEKEYQPAKDKLSMAQNSFNYKERNLKLLLVEKNDLVNTLARLEHAPPPPSTEAGAQS
jgi:peptidoglycan hydrolase CwlO-like protein